MSTVDLVKELTPKVEPVIEKHGDGEFEFTLSTFQINTNKGIIAKTANRSIRPSVFLNLSNNEMSKYHDIISSNIGTVETLPIRACYLLHKYNKAKKVKPSNTAKSQLCNKL